MNQGPISGRFTKKTRGQKSRATVPLSTNDSSVNIPAICYNIASELLKHIVNSMPDLCFFSPQQGAKLVKFYYLEISKLFFANVSIATFPLLKKIGYS